MALVKYTVVSLVIINAHTLLFCALMCIIKAIGKCILGMFCSRMGLPERQALHFESGWHEGSLIFHFRFLQNKPKLVGVGTGNFINDLELG